MTLSGWTVTRFFVDELDADVVDVDIFVTVESKSSSTITKSSESADSVEVDTGTDVQCPRSVMAAMILNGSEHECIVFMVYIFVSIGG